VRVYVSVSGHDFFFLGAVYARNDLAQTLIVSNTHSQHLRRILMLFWCLLLALCASVSQAILADWSLFPGDLFCNAPADTPVPRVGDATICLLSFADESPAGGCQLDYSTAQMRFVVTRRT
jgi:hypothetical protein